MDDVQPFAHLAWPSALLCPQSRLPELRNQIVLSAHRRALMSPGHLLQSGPGESAFNMALDEVLLQAMPRLGRPVLRFYGWTERAASFGYFQRYAEVERLVHLRPLVRRP